MNSVDLVSVGAAVASALFAALGILVSVWLVKSSDENRRSWELEQDKKRNSYDKDLQRNQQEWERAWRQELDEREQERLKPKLEVEIGYSMSFYPFAPAGQNTVTIKAKNVGVTNVHLLDPVGQLLLPDTRVLQPPDKDPINFRHDDVISPVQPGNSVMMSWNETYLRRQLANGGYSNDVQIRALVDDKLGSRHLSDVLSPPLHID